MLIPTSPFDLARMRQLELLIIMQQLNPEYERQHVSKETLVTLILEAQRAQQAHS